jgi:UDP-3-O-acyl-N-acetylglucosamine deacetylase
MTQPPATPEVTICDMSVAALVAALEQAGIPSREIGHSLIGFVVTIAREDPDHWISALYAAGVIVAQRSSTGKGN